VVVGHAQELRRRPGHKTDNADARWIAALLAHGLIRPSVLPPPPIQALRDLTRTRVALIQTLLVKSKKRGEKVLHAEFEGQKDQGHGSGGTHSHGVRDCLL
jgi:transposase